MDEQRLQEIRENRDPILLRIYEETQKTRKWVVLIGIMVIISIAVGIIAGLGTIASL